jgi:UDP-N-acetylmuramoyl-tripeptide--D-alanyl-D-alanine ligase
MNELGAESPRYHQEAGEAAAGVDLLVTLGRLAGDHLGPAAVRAGLDPTRWRHADTPQAAGEYLRALLQPGDIVLAKGSQNGVFAEEAVKILLANPADAAGLVRQSPAWMRKKA